MTNCYREGYEAVVAYFSRDPRPSFCSSLCPNFAPLSDSCAVADGRMEPARCPELANLERNHAA